MNQVCKSHSDVGMPGEHGSLNPMYFQHKGKEKAGTMSQREETLQGAFLSLYRRLRSFRLGKFTFP